MGQNNNSRRVVGNKTSAQLPEKGGKVKEEEVVENKK